MIATAATAMSAAIRPYSIAVTPRLSLIKRGGFPNAGYEPHPSCGDCSLTVSEPAKKRGQNIPKNRCRTTVAERMLETLVELPFIGDQVVCLSHDQARDDHPHNMLDRPSARSVDEHEGPPTEPGFPGSFLVMIS